MTVTLVLGGARSGKSRYAEGLAHGRKIYVATAEPFDAEMQARVRRHQQQRGDGWTTVEAPLALCQAIAGVRGCDCIVVDCVTVWLGNLMHHGREVGTEVSRLCSALKAAACDVIIVSNEVGLSIVPENAMARRFRDEQGLANQQLAGVADSVVLVAAGLPLKLK